MGTKKWSEIKTLSKATVADRAEARAELEEEIRSYCAPAAQRFVRRFVIRSPYVFCDFCAA